MGLCADDGVRLDCVHQDAQFEAVAALDEGADVASEQVKPEVVVERLPEFRGAADGGHVGVLDNGAPDRMGGFEQIEATGIRQRILPADFGFDGAGGGMVSAVADEVAD